MRKKIKLGIFFILTIALFLISISILGNLKLKGNGYRIYVDYVFIGDLLLYETLPFTSKSPINT